MQYEAIKTDWLAGAMGSAAPFLAQAALIPGDGNGVDMDTLADFRDAMRRHAAGVCILTSGCGEAVNGMVVTSATSFSFDPPSVLVCVNQSASIAAQLTEGSVFGLTVLGREQDGVAAACSQRPSGRARFDGGDWRFQADGPPQLEGAPANLTCEVERSLAYGSHVALIGRVAEVSLGSQRDSLIYRDGRYG